MNSWHGAVMNWWKPRSKKYKIITEQDNFGHIWFVAYEKILWFWKYVTLSLDYETCITRLKNQHYKKSRKIEEKIVLLDVELP